MDATENKYRDRIITIPNILSFFRLCLIPVIVWLYVVQGEPFWTAVVLTLSGITDIADGILARRCGMVSNFGKALDPIADKLTQITVLLCLVTRFPGMLLPLVLLTVKELLGMTLGLLIIRRTGTVHGAVWHGKLATVVLYGTMAIHLLWLRLPEWISILLIGACAGMILLSGILYAIRNARLLKGDTNES